MPLPFRAYQISSDEVRVSPGVVGLAFLCLFQTRNPSRPKTTKPRNVPTTRPAIFPGSGLEGVSVLGVLAVMAPLGFAPFCGDTGGHPDKPKRYHADIID